MEALFAAARRACPTPLWNKGSALARSGKVSLIRQDQEERILSVIDPRSGALCVRVYPDDEEWDCDCSSTAEACEHVAAAAIALRQDELGHQALARASERPGIEYNFLRCAPTLALERWIVQGKERERLRGALPRPEKAGFRISQADLRAQAVLDPPKRGALPEAQLRALFSILSESPTRLDGEVIELRSKAVLPYATLKDHPKGDGFVLRILADPRVEEVVGAGLVRCGQSLHFLGELKLCGLHMERLPLAKHFSADKVPGLFSKTLPSLKRRFRVDVLSEKIPQQTRALKPALRFTIARRGDTLDVTAHIAYGDPPVAKVVQKELKRIQGPLPKRDEEAEVQLRMQLRDKVSLVPEQRVYLHGSTAAEFVEALARLECTIEGFDPRVQAQKTLQPKISVEQGRVRLRFVLPDNQGEAQVSSAAVIDAWRQGHRQIMLGNASAAKLPKDWLDEHGPSVQALQQGSGKAKPVKELSALESLQLAQIYQSLNQPLAPELSRVAQLLDRFEAIPKAALPPDFCADLRPYQEIGVNWLSFMTQLQMGVLLADDMGLGKTVQCLAALRGRALVVCPSSLVFNWHKEALSFRPQTKICVFHGANRELDPPAELTITSYALLRQDARLREQQWSTVVLDEAQMIKNPQSQTSQAAFSLVAQSRIALSGTPVENRLDDLWSIMHFCNPGLLGGREEFDQRYGQPIAQGQKNAAQALQQKLRPVILRRSKSQVATDLPPRTEATIYCELSPEERRVYESYLAKSRASLSSEMHGEGPSSFSMLEQLLRLRQAACFRGMLPHQEARSSSKIERLLLALDKVVAGGHRALIFSQWTQMLDAIEGPLREAKISWSRIDGRTKKRGQIVEAFSAKDGPSVMLISLKAGGTGINLTAADHVFLVDPWWNPAAEAQAADRAHRIGQDKAVMVYRLVAKDTVEEKILVLQEQKRAIASEAMAGALVDQSLAKADLRALLA